MKGAIKILTLSILLASSLTTFAQLHGAVAVEGEYAPEIIEVERIGIFPSAVKLEAPVASLDFDRRGVVADFAPRLYTMGFTGWKALRDPDPYRGYASLQLGSFLNSNLSAGYTVLNNRTQRLDASLQFNSSSLFRPKFDGDYDGLTAPEMPQRKLYDGNIALNYSHLFDGKGILITSLNYRLGYFNYFGMPEYRMNESSEDGYKLTASTQTLNAFSLKAQWHPDPVNAGASADSGKWYAGINADYFGYRSLPASVSTYLEDIPDFSKVHGDREFQFALSGGYRLNTGENSAFNIDGLLDLLFYSTGRGFYTDMTVQDSALRENFLSKAPANYGMLTLLPGYTLQRSNLNLRLGVVANLSFNAQGNTPDSHYSLFHIAPDLRLDWRKDYVGLFLHALGGSKLHTLRGMEQYDYYQMPILLTTQPVYTPLDLEGGVTIGPLAGLYATLSAGYEISLHTPLCSRLISPEGPQGVDLHGLKTALQLGYRYGSKAGVSFSGAYTPQNGNKGVFNGLDRSRWRLKTEAFWYPVEKLLIEVGYEYRGVRNLYSYDPTVQIGVPQPVWQLTSLRLPDFTSLNAGVTFSPLKWLSLSCHAYNILGNHTPLLPGIPGEGVCITGGLEILF